MHQPIPEDDRSAMAKAIGRASEASTVAFTIGICFLLGYWLDSSLQSRPLFSVIGLVLGLITAFVQLIKLSKRIGQGTTTATGPESEAGSSEPESADND